MKPYAEAEEEHTEEEVAEIKCYGLTPFPVHLCHSHGGDREGGNDAEPGRMWSGVGVFFSLFLFLIILLCSTGKKLS